MRTDVKVGLICAFAIVLCVVIYFVARGKPQQPGAHAETPANSHVTPNSDLRVASPGTPSNPTVSPDPILPDHALTGTGSPIGGGLISPPGATPTPTPSPSPAGIPGSPTPSPAATPVVATPTPTTPVTPGMTGSTPVISASPLLPTIPTPTVTPTPGPTLILGSTGSTTGATTYKIQKGDMLGAIARKFNVSVRAIEEANPGVDSTRLKIDAVLKIPASTSTASTPRTPAPAVAASRPATARPTAASPRPTVVTIKPGSTYTVKKGDTLTTIARAAYGSPTGWQKIFRANRDALNDPDVTPVGATIKIP